jgi:hypothetical protein
MARSLAWLFAFLVLLSSLSSPRQARADEPACAKAAPECFVDLRGRTLDAQRAYARLHRPAKSNHLLALGEDLVFLAVGTTWYWIAKDKNIVDWDNPSAKARFTSDVIRMDNNTFPINFTLHPWSGAAYYSAARMSGVSLGLSTVYAYGATLAWEYGIEFHEKVSFNDLIFTPLPGITLGEFFSRLALYVNRYPGKPTLGQRFAGAIFGPLQAFSDLVGGQSKQVESAADNLGLSAAIHHAFRLHFGLALQSTATRDSLLADLGVDAALISIPSHGRPGRFRRLLRDGDFTRFRMSHVQGAGEREFDSYADLSLFGWYAQQISPDQRGGFFFLGSSLGYRYRRSLFKGYTDEFAATHLPGLALESALYFGSQLALRISYRLQPDFAGVHSLSYPVWQAANPDVQGKTVTEKYGYWYGFGVTSLFEANLSWSLLQLGGRAWFGYYNSTEGLDRAQEEIMADPRGYDRLLDAESYLRIALGHSGLQVELNLLLRRHLSRLGGYQADAQLLRPSARLGFGF